MRLTNHTKQRISKKWLQKQLDHLGVNPSIEIFYADNPEEVKTPNFKFEGEDVNGLAFETNEVFIYVGQWKGGKYRDWTPKFLKWILAHELRHQYYWYKLGTGWDKWRGLKKSDRLEREELACDRYANLVVGRVKKDFKMYR